VEGAHLLNLGIFAIFFLGGELLWLSYRMYQRDDFRRARLIELIELIGEQLSLKGTVARDF
jgi:hypothetical protein